MFYFDLHCHSVASDDSRATVEQYLKWISSLRKKGNKIDGIVLTEHRQFDFKADYKKIGEKYDITVLKGAELDTRYGHFLVYGVDEAIFSTLDFSDVNMDPFILMEACDSNGGIAIPAHPGRSGIGLSEWISKGVEFPMVDIVEHLNGGNRPEEAIKANELITENEYYGIGGSDAHFVSAICKCMTAFPSNIEDEKMLVKALKSREFHAVNLEDTI